MPQRFLRPGITNSSLWNAVDPQAANLFIRLLTQVDDYGRTDGRASVVLGHCFSVWNELNPKRPVRLTQVVELLGQLVDAKLIDLYELEGKRVIQVLQWQERIRENTKSKWPERTELAASCSKLLPPTPSPTPSPASPPTSNASGAHGSKKPARGNTDVEDAEWKRGLMSDVAYRHINIPVEFSKWQRWCARKKKKPTQARFEAWLNNIDAPVSTFAGARTVKPPKVLPDPPPEISEEQRLRNLAEISKITKGLRMGMQA